MTAGRPKIYDSKEITKDLLIYIENTADPMIEEFVLNSAFSGDTLYRLAKDDEKLSETIKNVHKKQSIRTQRLVEAGDMNPTWAIFKMKQPCYGWTDKQEVVNTNHNINEDVTELTSEERKERIKELTNKNKNGWISTFS